MTADVMATEDMIEIQRDESSEGDAAPLIKHNLHSTWCLWVNMFQGKKDRKEQWANANAMVHTLNTVEDFWCLYNNIVPPSRLVHGADFHLFKEGIEPKWEDATCKGGGVWKTSVPKGPNAKQHVDQSWLHLLLALIGEDFPESDTICGAVVSIRNRGDRVAVWTKTASNEAVQIAIGKHLKEVLDLGEMQTIGFTAHEDAMDANYNRRAKDRFTV